MAHDKFDREADRFLNRVRDEQPSWDQVGAVVGCLLSQMDGWNRLQLDFMVDGFIAHIEARGHNGGAV